MLAKLAEIFDTDVSTLLGGTIEQDSSVDIVAEQLSRINEQLVIKNKRTRRIWKIVGFVLLAVIIAQLILAVFWRVDFDNNKISTETYVEEYAVEVIED